jgi:hypothetical protein
MRTDDCGQYIEQMKVVEGVRDISPCTTVKEVHCFHQPPSQDEPDGQEICQATLTECKAAREDVIKAKMAVDSECQLR